jgi:hypothetical protein
VSRFVSPRPHSIRGRRSLWPLLLAAAVAAAATAPSAAQPARAAATVVPVAARASDLATQASAPGWRPYSAASPFNAPLGRLRPSPGSARMVARLLDWSGGGPGKVVLGGSGTRDDYGHPIYFAAPGDPTVTLHATESWGRNPLDGVHIPVPQGARAAGGDDEHMTVVTPDGWEYDLWQVHGGGAADARLSFGWGGRVRLDGDGLGGAATSSGFASMAGIIRPQELAAGRIRHALFITSRCTTGFVFPAAKGGRECATGVDGPPMGAHVALALSRARIDRLPVPPWKRAIMRALATYGGYIGDTGGSGFGVQAESGASWTSFGLEDPFVAFARDSGLADNGGRYALDLKSGLDWARHLRVVLPPRRS